LLHLRNAAERSSVECLLSELGWREFAYQVLWNYPQTSRESMNPRFHDDFWKEDTEALHAWQHGSTGIDLVDAGMRELWETGWMHNRVRMVTASFLTKNLGLHWLHGALWFWDTLVDADLASNTLGWQWVAGCGVDAAPYYRIFNPLRQAKKFDSSGIYIDRWIAGRTCSPGLVDLEASRREALERYKHAAGIRDDVAGKTR
jgi:deoxyribodipyrimidine photo-lyase